MNSDVYVIVNRFYDDGIETLSHIYVVQGKKLLGAFCGMEKPWASNQKNVSCIPCGQYMCRKRDATQKIKYRHILIEDVPNRDGICIHVGNYHTSVQGCLAVGTEFSDINSDGIMDITSSRLAFDKLMTLVPENFCIKFI